jgi:hypothetical protein
MSSADVTRRELSFGAQDTITGWYTKVYTDTIIKGSMQPQGAAIAGLPCGFYAKYPHTFFTEYVVHEGDLIKDVYLVEYELHTVVPWMWLDQFSHYTCEAVKLEVPKRGATSGTWHTDADTLTTDPRSRHKIYLDTYLAVSPDIITCFDGADYPIKYLFDTALGVDVDCVVSIGKDNASSLLDYLHKIYGFIESVPITVYGLAANEVESVEQSIRHVFTDYPIVDGRTVRSIQSVKHAPIDLGAKNLLWSTTVTVKYLRANDEYLPTLPTLTWGSAAGTFVFPNVINKVERYVNNDVYMDMPGRLGSYPQALGSKSLEVELTCDLDLNPDNLTWKRSAAAPWQSGAVKSDVSNYQVFQDIIHEGADSEAYQTLTLEWGSFKVRLTDMQLGQDGVQSHLTLTFKEYNSTAANTAYKTRWGIT